MNERVKNLVRINKTDAEMLYYNGLGVILNTKNINPFHLVGNTSVLKYIEQKEEFSSLLNHFTFYNGEAWYWTDKQNKEILDNRKAEYKKLKHYSQICKIYNIDINKPITASDWRKLSSNNTYNCINIIYDYIIKYKPVSTNCLTDRNEYNKLCAFLKTFDMDGCIQLDDFQKVMKRVGFK